MYTCDRASAHGRVLSLLPRNFLVTSIFLETTNPSRYVQAPFGKTKVSLFQRALVLQSSFLRSPRSLFFSLRSWPSYCLGTSTLSFYLATRPRAIFERLKTSLFFLLIIFIIHLRNYFSKDQFDLTLYTQRLVNI